MEDLYPNLFVQYLYKECSETQTTQVEEMLQTNDKAKEMFTQLKEGQALLTEYFPLQYPKQISLQHILDYAKK